MNNKLEIWKRKLAKNKLKQQMAMWDRLKQTHPKYRKLNAKWTMDEFTELESMFGMDLENEMADILAKEIDKEILKSLTGDANE